MHPGRLLPVVRPATCFFHLEIGSTSLQRLLLNRQVASRHCISPFGCFARP
jgi:hypothetical protein